MIDILISTYNGQKFLKEQIDSLLSQTYSDFKIIIRDDGSKDLTLHILQDYQIINKDKIIIIDSKGSNLGSSKSFLELLKIRQESIYFSVIKMMYGIMIN